MNGNNPSASTPRGAADAKPVQASNGQPVAPWWVSLRAGLQLASQLIVASPVRLPANVVTAAKYINLALGIWESFDGRQAAPAGPDTEPGDEAEAANAP